MTSGLCKFVRREKTEKSHWQCDQCGHVTPIRFTKAPVRYCKSPGESGRAQSRYVAPPANIDERLAWCTCDRRGKVLATVTGMQSGCGCGGMEIPVYQCSRFNEPVLKQAAARCLEKIQAKVPGYKGRTCRECEVPRSAGKPETLPESPPSPQTIGVVVTCHNYGRYLRQCLDSVLAQSHPPCEIVLVDDASTDDTPAVAAEYAARGVRYLRTEFRDVALARNAGAELCGKPSFYCFIDADDILPFDYLQYLLDGMDSNTVGVTYNHLDRFGGQTGIAPYVFPFDAMRLYRANMIPASALIRQLPFEQAGKWQPSGAGLQDWDLWLRIHAAGWGLKLCEKARLRYRVHSDSMLRTRSGSVNPIVGVVRKSQVTAVVTLFSGRAWALDRYFANLAKIDWNLHLVAIDNSNQPVFSGLLLSRLGESGRPFTYVRESAQIVATVLAADIADSAAMRTNHVYAMGSHLAKLYALATANLPAICGKVWSVEDDVGIEPDVLERLCATLYLERAVAVVGAMRTRFGKPPLLLCKINGRRPVAPPETPTPVTETGFYCLLAHRDAWGSIAWRPGESGDHQPPYYDWAATHDLLRVGPVVLDPSVRCEHWQADGSCLIV